MVNGLHTLGDKPAVQILKEESYGIAHSFICGAVAPQGTLVKLNSDGTVDPVTAVTQVPIGVLTTACTEADSRVTVLTEFSMIVEVESDGGHTCGNQLAQSGINTAGDRAKFKVAVSTNWVSATALSTVTTTNKGFVGIHRQPFLKA